MIDTLESLKQIDLRSIAAAHGYRFDPKDTWAAHEAWRQEDRKVYISQKPNGNWFYWNPKTGQKGNPIGFLINEGFAENASAAVKWLREWSFQPVKVEYKFAPLEIASAPNLAAVRDAVQDMRPVTRSPYLEEERRIPHAVLQSWRFASRILEDNRQNIVFPHVNGEGICGGEVRNVDFKGFLKGGVKGLWMSKCSANDNALVVTESALDALAHFAMFDTGRMRYASLGGTPSAAQAELLRKEIERLARGSEVHAATDNDAAGDKAAEFIKAACEASLQDGAYIRSSPAPHKDFNAMLKACRI